MPELLSAPEQRSVQPLRLRLLGSFADFVLDPVPQQYGAAVQRFAALERHRFEGRRLPAISLTGIERTRCAFGAVNAGTNNKVDLVDQPGAQKRHVSCAAPLYQQS